MKRICIYVALGVLGAFSAHAQEIIMPWEHISIFLTAEAML